MKRNHLKRKSILIGTYQMNYTFISNDSRNLLVCFPQGLRDDVYFLDSYGHLLPENVNIIILNPPSIGGSDKLGKEFSMKFLHKFLSAVIEEEGFEIKDTTLFGKSFTSVYIEGVLRLNQNYKNIVICAGPRLLSTTQTRKVLRFATMSSRFYPLRFCFHTILTILERFTDIKQTYYNWKWAEPYWHLKEICKNRLQKMPTFKTPAKFIFNGKDELVSTKNRIEILSAFPNSESHLLATTSHWGPLTQEEQNKLKEYLQTSVDSLRN